MRDTDTAFAGSIPELYDRHLGPMFFAPYAADMARRARVLSPRRLLEVAAGTGIVTGALLRALPEAEIEATDLNGPMLALAASRLPDPRLRWSQADALRLPFVDRSFDLVVCQFAVMFFPDRPAAFREARRVLGPGGSYLFSVWDGLAHNHFARVVSDAVAAVFPQDPPSFLRRVPHGHGDCAAIERELRACGFSRIEHEAVAERSRSASARDVAVGLCEGTPLRHEIVSRDPAALSRAVDAATRALREEFGDGPLDGQMRAFVFTAGQAPFPAR